VRSALTGIFFKWAGQMELITITLQNRHKQVMSLLDYTFMGSANFAILQCIIVKMGVIYTWQSDLLVQREYGKPHTLAFHIK
jgi:hypothetical protein